MARGGLAIVKFVNPRRIAEALKALHGRLPGDVTPPWGIPEGPEVEPPDVDEDMTPPWGLEGPIHPTEPDAPEIWPPLDLVPPPGPTPEYFYVGCYHPSIGLRYVKFHGPTMKEKLQALKDRLPAGGIGGRPPVRPGG